MIKSISILGYRGFGIIQTIPFAIPDGQTDGSGLTIMTGSNNSGKTTVIEAIRAFNGFESPSFSEGKRNRKTNSVVSLQMKLEDDRIISIDSIPGGGSSTKKSVDYRPDIYVVPSRRFVQFEFGKYSNSRENYIQHSLRLQNQRNATLDGFESRLFSIEQNKDLFDRTIQKVMGPNFQWTIELLDSGSYYVKYSNNGISHNIEGVGDGVWSVFTICAALFDAPEYSTVVIDEPELSVHPSLQKKLRDLLIEYSQKIQIIISTHSPFFISWDAIKNGAVLLRIVKEGADSFCYSLSNSTRNSIIGLLNNINNPHTLGLEANEAFFLNDGIILVEGQEDVIIYRKIADELGLAFDGDFFGWGAGGAGNMHMLLQLFDDLGYKKVVAIYDGDKKDDAEKARELYPDYKVIVLSKDDIRDKKERTIKGKEGLTESSGKLKPENVEYCIQLINSINAYICKA